MSETWKSVVGYEGLYEISDMGQLRSLGRWSRNCHGPTWIKPKMLKPWQVKEGNKRRLAFSLRRDGIVSKKYIHRLVLEAFVGPCPEGMEACHNNGDSTDNRLANLRWDTHPNNLADCIVHGTRLRGERQNGAKLTVNAVRAIRAAQGLTHKQLAVTYGVASSNISAIRARKKWAWLT